MMMIHPLHRLLADWPAEALAHHDGRRFVTVGEFRAGIAARCAQLRARPQRRWLLASAEPAEFAMSLLAVLAAGAEAVIPPNTQPATLALLAGAFDAIAPSDDAPAPSPPGADALAPIDPRIAVIDLYTSGSTGTPKRVRKTLWNFEREIETLEALWGDAVAEAAVIASAPHLHFYGLLFRLFWPLSTGRVFDSVTCNDMDTLAARSTALAPTVLVSSPAQLSRWPDMSPLASIPHFPTLVFSSGGPLPPATAAVYLEHTSAAPTEVFGSTETGGIAWRRQEPGPDWTPMPGIEVQRDTDGALLLFSPFLEDAAPWRMDDAVELQGRGRFRLQGRLDRVVKVEEKRVSLPEMEAVLATHPWIASAAAVVLHGRRQRVGIVAVLHAAGREALASKGRRILAHGLREHMASRFDTVVLPRHWRFVHELPVDERGKLTSARLQALFVVDADAQPAA